MLSLLLRSTGSISLSSVVQFSGAGPLALVGQQRLMHLPHHGCRPVLLSGMVVAEAERSRWLFPPYRVALALVELDGKRAQPLTDKSRSAAAAEAPDPGQDSSLLLGIPLETKSEQLPVFKTDWMSGSVDTNGCIVPIR